MRIDPGLRQSNTGEPQAVADNPTGRRWQANDVARRLMRGAFAFAILWAATILFPYYCNKIAAGLSGREFDSVAAASTIMLAACVGESCTLLRQMSFIFTVVAWTAILVVKLCNGAREKLETWLT